MCAGPIENTCTLIVFGMCFLLLMNYSYFEDLVTSPTFSKLSELNHRFIIETMLGPSPAKIVSIGGDVASKGVAPEVVSMEASTLMLMTPRSPRLKPTRIRET